MENINYRQNILENIVDMVLFNTGYYLIRNSLLGEENGLYKFTPDKYFSGVGDFNIRTLGGSSDIITVTVNEVDFGAPIKIKSNVTTNLTFLFVFNDNTITDIKINIENIKFNENWNIHIFNYFNNLCSYLSYSLYDIIESSEGLYLKNDKSKYIVQNDVIFYEIEVNKPELISVYDLFTNLMRVNYKIEVSEEVQSRIKAYSNKLYNAVRKIVDIEENEFIEDIYKIGMVSYDVNASKFNDDFDDKYFGKELYSNNEIFKNIIINKVYREKKVSPADVLLLYDTIGVNLKSLRLKI